MQDTAQPAPDGEDVMPAEPRKSIWETAEWVDPNSPKGLDMRVNFMGGFLQFHLARSRKKREQEEAKQAEQDAAEHAAPAPVPDAEGSA